jgi:putative MATE family efflux protein
MSATLANQAERISPPPDNLPANKLLHGPLLSTLIRLALPTIAVLFMTTVVSVAETYFVSSLGLKAIAAASLVVPVMLLMTTVASAGIGGGVSSAVARAIGARRQDEAESLTWHAVVIGAVGGGLFSLAALLAGPALYRSLGGSGASLDLAVLYSNILFGGATSFWILLLLLQAALRGTGNVKVPAMTILGGAFVGLILSPVLINGWLGAPRMGVAGAGVAQVLCNIASLAVVVAYMRSPSTTLRLRRYPLRRAHFGAILSVGLVSSVNVVMLAMSVTALTAAAGSVSVAAIAGYGIASRLEMLLAPVMFGCGTAAITLVGTNLGAGNVARARRVAVVNVLFVAGVVGLVGLFVSLFPQLWLGLFTSDRAVMAVGTQYLHVVAPFYAVIGVIFELYFAGQGARRILWPMAASVVRCVFALASMVLVLRGYASLHTSFVLVAVGIAVAATISLLGFLRSRWDR